MLYLFGINSFYRIAFQSRLRSHRSRHDNRQLRLSLLMFLMKWIERRHSINFTKSFGIESTQRLAIRDISPTKLRPTLLEFTS